MDIEGYTYEYDPKKSSRENAEASTLMDPIRARFAPTATDMRVWALNAAMFPQLRKASDGRQT